MITPYTDYLLHVMITFTTSSWT